jgi:hypothetical protein
VQEYLQELDHFLELALVCVHMEYRQPAQGSELITIWHCNRLLQDRNLVIVGAAIIIII